MSTQLYLLNIFLKLFSSAETTSLKNQAANNLLFSYWKSYLTFSLSSFQFSLSDLLKSPNLNSPPFNIPFPSALKHLMDLFFSLPLGWKLQCNQRLTSGMTGWESNLCFAFRCCRKRDPYLSMWVSEELLTYKRYITDHIYALSDSPSVSLQETEVAEAPLSLIVKVKPWRKNRSRGWAETREK